MQPVVSKHIKMSELYDCTYDLGQIAELNEALDVAAENEFRFSQAMNRSNE